MNSKVFSPILSIIIILTALSAAGIYIALNRNNDAQNYMQLDNNTSETSNKDVGNWNHYESDKVGVKFKYPASYRVEEELNEIKIIETPLGEASDPRYPIEPYSFYAYLVVEDNINNFTPVDYFIEALCNEGVTPDAIENEWRKKLKQGCVNLFNESKENYNANGIEGILGTYNPYEHGHPIFVFTKGNQIYAFHLGNTGETGHFPNENQISLFKKILSTLEVTKKFKTSL